MLAPQASAAALHHSRIMIHQPPVVPAAKPSEHPRFSADEFSSSKTS